MKKWKYFIVIIFVVFIGIVGILLGISFRKEKEQETQSNAIAYEANVIVDNEDALQAAVDKLVEKAKEGQMTLEMKNEAISVNGKDFECYIGNAINNNYDMFIVVYHDETQKEIFRSGLIPIGAHMEKISLQNELEEGTHEITLVYNQVEKDKETIHAQVNVGMTFIVE